VNAASPHLARLGAVSRPTGGAAIGDARAYCTNVLRELGFATSEQPFEYSTFAGAFAVPAVGVLIPPFAWLLFDAQSLSTGALIGLLAFAAVAALALRYTAGKGVLDLPILRRQGVNLQAVRGGEEPLVWIIAHLDSKSQPVAMMTRVAGIIAAAIGVGLLAIIAIARLEAPDALALALLGLAWVGALPLIFSFVRADNHGTLDNASGVATVLEAAAMIPATARVGILITDAEELAVAGALAWSRSRPPATALNCDSVDDNGPLVAMYSRSAPEQVVSRLSAAAVQNGEVLRVTRLIPGILTDHVPLAAAGWKTLTLSRGTFRTLQRIHTTRDTLDWMRGRGISGAARVLARTATELS
jgi:hypothetical protein